MASTAAAWVALGVSVLSICITFALKLWDFRNASIQLVGEVVRRYYEHAQLDLADLYEEQQRRHTAVAQCGLSFDDFRNARAYLNNQTQGNLQAEYDAYKFKWGALYAYLRSDAGRSPDRVKQRMRLRGFWDEVVELHKGKQLPDIFFDGVWVTRSNNFRLLVELMDIANYYNNRLHGESNAIPSEYLDDKDPLSDASANRPEVYPYLEFVWKQRKKTDPSTSIAFAYMERRLRQLRQPPQHEV